MNRALDWVPWADVQYASDVGFWKEYRKRFAWFAGERVSIAPVERYGVRQVGTSTNARGLDPERIYLGGPKDRNSGLQALSLAHIRGARKIVLLGHDGKFAADGRRHCHEDHPHPLGNAGAVGQWVDAYARLGKLLADAGVEVLNCTRETAHKLPRADFDETLEALRRGE